MIQYAQLNKKKNCLAYFSFFQNQDYPYSRAFDCGFCLFGRAFDQLFFQKSNSPGVARGGGLIAVGFDSYIGGGLKKFFQYSTFSLNIQKIFRINQKIFRIYDILPGNEKIFRK
jgi:hypothetical protein